jgi:hypothetical protein
MRRIRRIAARLDAHDSAHARTVRIAPPRFIRGGGTDARAATGSADRRETAVNGAGPATASAT